MGSFFVSLRLNTGQQMLRAPVPLAEWQPAAPRRRPVPARSDLRKAPAETSDTTRVGRNPMRYHAREVIPREGQGNR